MNRFLTSNERQWRFMRTVVQGVLGVVVANVDLLMGVAVLSPVIAELGKAGDSDE